MKTVNLSQLIIDPETEIVIIPKTELEDIKEDLESKNKLNQILHSLLKGCYDDMHRLKKEVRELRKRLEYD